MRRGAPRPRFTTGPFAILIAMSALFAMACSCEESASSHATFEDAVQAGVARRGGWLPEFVPASAVEIEEAHDLDTNLQRIRFRAPQDALERMAAGLEPLAPSRAAPSRRTPSIRGAWPRALDEGKVPPSFRTYRYRRPLEAGKSPLLALPPLCVAVDLAARTSYAWSCEAPAGPLGP